MSSRFSVAVLAIVLCGCSSVADYGNAKDASVRFHRLMDDGDYSPIFREAAEGFKESAPPEQLSAFFKRVARKLGTCGEAKIAFAGYQVTTSGTFVSMTASRSCANGKLDEQFVWLMTRGKAALLRYQANSPLLLTDEAEKLGNSAARIRQSIRQSLHD